MKKYRCLVTLMVVLTILCLLSVPASAKGATGHGVILPMPKATLWENLSKTLDFSSYEFRVTRGNKTETVEKKGKYWYLKYRFLLGTGKVDTSVSALEILENYKSASISKGATIHYERGKKLTFSLPKEDGGTTWVHLNASDGHYLLHIVDVAGMVQQLKFGAEELALELDTTGSVKVYGIHFGVDSDKLMPGAEEVLVELVKLMKNDLSLKIEISGHTDNTGSASHNLGLSKQRANTVSQFLELFGIASWRMETKGYGLEQPVASNDTEDGRALNRRVELRKLN